MNDKLLKKYKENPFVTTTFKLWLAGLIIFLIFVHLFSIIYFPRNEIIPPEILLGVTLVLGAYLWVQELRDKHRIKTLNAVFLDTQEQLESAEVNTIASLILSEEAKDHYTQGHSKRVTRCAVTLAEKMGLPESFQKIISRASILHDIGKVGISDSILRKPDKLTDEEWAIIKKHPRIGAEILEPLKFLEEEKNIIYHHHERYDGKGYPDGISGENIPLGARIIAIADTFDAMNSARPYRTSLPEEEITAEIARVAGSQLDPGIVEIFLDLLKNKPSLWSRDSFLH